MDGAGFLAMLWVTEASASSAQELGSSAMVATSCGGYSVLLGGGWLAYNGELDSSGVPVCCVGVSWLCGDES